MTLAALTMGVVMAPQMAEAKWFGKKDADTAAKPCAMNSKCCNKSEKTSNETIPQVAQEAGQFTILTKALKATQLDGALSQDGPFTVFAPTDEAFRKQFTPEELNTLLLPENKAKLSRVLKFHVVPGNFSSQQVMEASSLKTLEGQSLPVEQTAGMVEIGDAKVVKTDVAARNGVIHAIDKVLMPSN